MNILVITPIFPAVLNSGSKIRIFNIVRSLANGNTLTLASLIENGAEAKNVEILSFINNLILVNHNYSKVAALARWVFSLYPYRYCKMFNRRFRKEIGRHLESNKYDLVYINFIDSTQFVSEKHLRNNVVLIDQHNNDIEWYKSFLNSISPLKRLFAKVNIKRQKARNQKDYKFCDICVPATREDLISINGQIKQDIIYYVLPNGIDFRYGIERNLNSDVLIFCGSLNVEMNIDAVKRLVTKILPRILSIRPDVRLIIAGSNPTKQIAKLCSRPGIEFYPNVDSVIPLYRKSAICVMPFRHGGGAKLKLLESLSMGLDVVTTAVGAVGVDYNLRKYLHIAVSDNDFCDAVVSVLEKRKSQSDSSFIKIRDELKAIYDWDKNVGGLQLEFKKFIGKI